MDRSIFLARLVGPTLIAVALGMLVNIGMYEKMIVDALHFGILIYLSGLLSMLAGLAIVNLHNKWQLDWRLVITILGWLMTIGGIIRIALPKVAIAAGSTIYSGRASIVVVAMISGLLGAFLSFKGYGGVAEGQVRRDG